MAPTARTLSTCRRSKPPPRVPGSPRPASARGLCGRSSRGRRPCRVPSFTRAGSAAVLRDRVGLLAVADVEVVVVAGEPRRPALPDEHRIIEVDELDVARRGRPDDVDQLPGRGP